MSDRLTSWENWIIRFGIFLIFVVTFGDYVLKKIWTVLGPLFRR